SWILMTVLFVTQNGYGATRVRILHRAGGTLAGLIIAGITLPSEGGLLCDNREIAGPGPERAVVFQNHSLLPWLTCFDNVALAVDQVFRKTMDKAQRREWIIHNLE
ncbi:FUSC family protein, partial [Leptospira borgpetersenii serovar Hardjo-bovis]|nr:FUSC family protein [Leptospira borgpetersenii serovar Hardjo-bovis]